MEIVFLETGGTTEEEPLAARLAARRGIIYMK